MAKLWLLAPSSPEVARLWLMETPPPLLLLLLLLTLLHGCGGSHGWTFLCFLSVSAVCFVRYGAATKRAAGTSSDRLDPHFKETCAEAILGMADCNWVARRPAIALALLVSLRRQLRVCQAAGCRLLLMLLLCVLLLLLLLLLLLHPLLTHHRRGAFCHLLRLVPRRWRFLLALRAFSLCRAPQCWAWWAAFHGALVTSWLFSRLSHFWPGTHRILGARQPYWMAANMQATIATNIRTQLFPALPALILLALAVSKALYESKSGRRTAVTRSKATLLRFPTAATLATISLP